MKKTTLVNLVGMMLVTTNANVFAVDVNYTLRGCSFIENTVLGTSGGTTIGYSRSRGASQSVPPGNPDSFDGMSYDCLSVWDAKKAGVSFSGRCTFVGSGEDSFVGAFEPSPGGWTWRFISGSGKWAGITGGGESRITKQHANLSPSSKTNCWEGEGTYSLTK